MGVVEGRGLVALRDLAPGEFIFDPTVVYCCGTRRPESGYDYINFGTGTGTFALLRSGDKSAYTFFTNTKAKHSINIKWANEHAYSYPRRRARARKRRV